MTNLRRCAPGLLLFLTALGTVAVAADRAAGEALKKLDVDRGIVAVIELPRQDAQYVIDLAKAGEATLYVVAEFARIQSFHGLA